MNSDKATKSKLSSSSSHFYATPPGYFAFNSEKLLIMRRGPIFQYFYNGKCN